MGWHRRAGYYYLAKTIAQRLAQIISCAVWNKIKCMEYLLLQTIPYNPLRILLHN